MMNSPAASGHPRCRVPAVYAIAGWLLLQCASATQAGAVTGDHVGPSFRNEVMAVLSQAGCNRGACHGNLHGKGGLKLSLRGQDPDADFRTLTRGLGSRRVNTVQPELSLLLQKPLMQVPHEGGRRFDADSQSFQILRDWIAGGIPADDDAAPRLVSLQVEPQHHTILFPARQVQIRASGRFSDGSERDVTELAVFESSDPAVQVSPSGLVEAESPTLTTVTVRYLNQQQPVRLEFVAERPDFQFVAPQSANAIDEIVFAQLRRLRISPSALCDDVTFLRRAYLDLTGLLPLADDAKQFVASDQPDKRARLIDRLLASPQFNDQQALHWADLLRVEDKTLDPKGVSVFHQWIRHSFSASKPLNEFVRELIVARGSTYQVAPANFYRALRKPDERAEACAQVFLGIRLQCAKCHNHPFDRWTQDDYYNWTNLFARIDYEIVENKRRDENDKHEFKGEQIVVIKDEGDVTNPSTGRVAGLGFLEAQPPGGATGSSPTSIDGGADRLQQLAAWLTGPANRQFAEMQANRIWYQMMGRGVVDPIDDFRSTNPPSNPELLRLLADELVISGFDVRHLMRLIMNSSTYQLSWETNSTNDVDDILFSHVVPRRLTAEQALDAVSAALQVDVEFGGHDRGVRAVQLEGVRNGDNRFSAPGPGDRFLKLFGKPSRLQTCECERSDDITLAQTFELIGGELVSEAIRSEQSCIQRAVSSDQSTEEFLTDLYWSALSRAPAGAELQQLQSYVDSAADRRQGLEDAVWAVLNSNEFMLRR